jgi:hypothetical protein
MAFSFLHLSQSLKKTFPVRASEWALALMLLNWSIVLSASPELFETNEAYLPLLALMTQNTWALLCFIAGGGRLIVLLINGSWRRTPHLRAFGAFASCFFWVQISIGFAQADIWGTGMAIYPVLLLLDMYNVIRAITDAAIVDRHFKEVAVHGVHT